jgi:DNA-binding NarL/FixJ family response regulator
MRCAPGRIPTCDTRFTRKARSGLGGGARGAHQTDLQSATESPEGDWHLTGRHRELVRMLGGGLTDEAMARKLGVSERTVRRLVSELTERLGAASRFQAGVCAVRLGWLDD